MTTRLQDIAYFHWGHTKEPNGCVNEDQECLICGVLCCPAGEPLHFHHDGCPACTQHDPEPEQLTYKDLGKL